MLKILINYDYEYSPYTTAFYYEKAFKKRVDVEVYRDGEKSINDCDVVINFMPCKNLFYHPDIVTVYWEGDSHVIQGAKQHWYAVSDLVFHCQPSYAQLYPPEKTHLLLHACDPELHRPFYYEPKLFDVGFLGNDTYPERRTLLELLAKDFKVLRSTEKPGLPYSQRLATARCVFNKSYLSDINMRIFEAMGCGLPLVTDDVPFLEMAGTANEDFLVYHNYPELKKFVAMLKESPDFAKKLGARARDHVIAHHTYDHRVDEMLKIINDFMGIKDPIV